ncbi:MAG: Smr/MutS family protein [Desulfurivibrio sp.]|nr:Smr/MutS family protein [Desulfurivibrio sp.]
MGKSSSSKPAAASYATSATDNTAGDFASVVERYLDDHALRQATVNSQRARPSLARRLRAYPPPQEELDLHGLTAAAAETALHRFIEHCRVLQLATLRIITGKGLHSAGEPVLPPLAEATLEGMQRGRQILAYRWEGRRRAGGALIVYLPGEERDLP